MYAVKYNGVISLRTYDYDYNYLRCLRVPCMGNPRHTYGFKSSLNINSLWPATFLPTGYGLLMHCSRKQHIRSNAWHYHTLSVVHNKHCEYKKTCTIGPLC